MANITRRESKKGTSYRIQILKGITPDGRRDFYTETFYPTSRGEKAQYREAVAYGESLERRIKNGEVIVGAQITFNDLIEEWRASNRYKSISTSCRETYEAMLNYPELADLRAEKVKKINVLYMQHVIDSLSTNMLNGKPRSASTVQHIYVVLNGIFKNAYRLELIDRNPLDRVELPVKKNADEKEEDIHFFDIDQAKRFLRYLDLPFEVQSGTRQDMTMVRNGKEYMIKGCEVKKEVIVSDQWKCYFMLALLSGARRGELCALTWADVDFENCTISINKAIARTKDRELVKSPKTKAGRRVFSLPTEVFEKLQLWQIQQKADRLKLGTAWKGEELQRFDQQHIFITAFGSRMCVDTPSHKFGELLEMINKKIEDEAAAITDPVLKDKKLSEKLPIIRAHDLRHTAASLMVAQGVNPKTISARLGHSRTSTTLEVYSHALPSQDEIASNAIGNMFFDHGSGSAAQA